MNGISRRLSWIVLCLLVPGASPAALDAQVVVVTRWQFTSGVSDREPVDELQDPQSLAPGTPVYLWTEIRGGQDAWNRLLAEESFNVTHIWRRGLIGTDRIEVGISQERWLEQRTRLENEMREMGFFTWRVWSRKKNWREGRYTILLEDDTQALIAPLGSTQPIRPSLELVRLGP